MAKEIIEVTRRKPKVLETDLFFDEEIYIREPCDFKSKGYDEIVYILYDDRINVSLNMQNYFINSILYFILSRICSLS